jgi:AraC family transcriptional regulator of adaptative response/methylated-DNA-[protein]-cysteine methyltransferase
MYRALTRRDSSFDGVFFIGVKTTGIFCRPTCTAKKPLATNIDYFPTAQSALSAGYRACKRCRPLDQPGTPPRWLVDLRNAIDKNPSFRLRDSDLRNRHLDPATTRRHFKRHYGMTFHAYARARRVGTALKSLRNPATKSRPARTPMSTLHTAAGYESESGFRDACHRLFGTTSSSTNILAARWLTTPLGPMIALADDSGLRTLEYLDRRGLESQVLRLRKKLQAAILPADHPHLDTIQHELALYFEGKSLPYSPVLKEEPQSRAAQAAGASRSQQHLAYHKGETSHKPLPPAALRKLPSLPLTPPGSPFQHQVWNELKHIPLGTTISYAQLAQRINRPTATRAVARANGDNYLAILIPCHRVIGSDGSPTGYGGGIWRKLWLLDHERKMAGISDGLFAR